MRRTVPFLLAAALCLVTFSLAGAAHVVPNKIKQPGIQPEDNANFESLVNSIENKNNF